MTRIWIWIFAGAAISMAAQDKLTLSKAAPPAAPAAVVTIPKGAVETDPGTWRYTDSDGRKWLYRKNAFGTVRAEDKPDEAGDAARRKLLGAFLGATLGAPPVKGGLFTTSEEARLKLRDTIQATEDGDSVRFENANAFGTYKWTRKKSELDETERQVWERSRAAASGKKQE